MSLADASKLYKFLEENPSEEAYRYAIQIPQDTRLEDWLAVVTIEIFDNLTRIYSTLSNYCVDSICPRMSVGISYEFLWNEYQDSNSSIKHNKIHCTAPQYIHEFITFVKDTISDTAIFPSQHTTHNPSNAFEYPKNFHSIIHFICKHMFRVFGHMYCKHLSSITSLQLHTYLNTCFKHFLYFIEEFQLVPVTQLKPLNRYIQISLGRSFGKIHRYNTQMHSMYHTHTDINADITAFSSIEHSSQISNLSLPKSPTKSEVHSNNTVIEKNISNSFGSIKRNISIELGTEYKEMDSTSVRTDSLNSLTPFPTYRQSFMKNGENNNTQNKSVYEYVFHHKNEGILRNNETEIEEKSSEDYIQKTEFRKCKIIRNSNAKNNGNINAFAEVRIPLLSVGDLNETILPIPPYENTNLCVPNIGSNQLCAFSPYTPKTQQFEKSKNEITPTPEPIIRGNIESPSLRDVVFYRSKVRKLQSEVNVLKDENKELKMNGSHPKKKKRRKKKKRNTEETEANMAKLVDIMDSMNRAVKKLAEAVTEVVHSTDDEKIEYGIDDKKNELILSENNKCEKDLKSAKNVLRKDFREYLQNRKM